VGRQEKRVYPHENVNRLHVKQLWLDGISQGIPRTYLIPASTAPIASVFSLPTLFGCIRRSVEIHRVCSVRAMLSPGQPLVPGSVIFWDSGIKIRNCLLALLTTVDRGTTMQIFGSAILIGSAVTTTTGMGSVESTTTGRSLPCSLPMVSSWGKVAHQISPREGMARGVGGFTIIQLLTIPHLRDPTEYQASPSSEKLGNYEAQGPF
jgi:hypothetical protein